MGRLSERAIEFKFDESNNLVVVTDLRRVYEIPVLTSRGKLPTWKRLDPTLLQEPVESKGAFLSTPSSVSLNSDCTQVAVAYRSFPLSVWIVNPPEVVAHLKKRQWHGEGPAISHTGTNKIVQHHLTIILLEYMAASSNGAQKMTVAKRAITVKKFSSNPDVGGERLATDAYVEKRAPVERDPTQQLIFSNDNKKIFKAQVIYLPSGRVIAELTILDGKHARWGFHHSNPDYLVYLSTGSIGIYTWALEKQHETPPESPT
ncbi:hypothetical protein F4809DRAFT_595826 [Biscogniauxia mediterranea]|nr:hypothetical protein F4809DRAFT_595826 [Biscogniauxia mediterranea]